MKYICLLAITLSVACSSKSKTATNHIDYDSIKLTLEEMYETDQMYRQEVSDMIINKEPFNFELVNKMNKADSINQIEVVKLLDQYGWLPKSKIGEDASDAIFYIIQHSPLETMEVYFPQLKQLASKDEASAVHAAMMEDRILMYQGKHQIYGTQAKSMDLGDGNTDTYIWPIRNPENVNERRKTAGFEDTVEENAAGMNAIYDPALPIPNISSE